MKKERFIVSDIDWCIDEEYLAEGDSVESVLEGLPDCILVDIDNEDSLYEYDKDCYYEESIEDILTDKYGWLVNGFSYELYSDYMERERDRKLGDLGL